MLKKGFFMIIGTTKEESSKETRIALTPDVVKQLTLAGHTILIEKDYGASAEYKNDDYLSVGAKLIENKQKIFKTSQIILQIQPPNQHILKNLNKNQLVIADFSHTNLSKINTKCKILRLELVPRISNTQNIDILSSQSTVRGYMAALYALSISPRIAPQLTTAAASITAAKALIIGASLTGLQAASVFKRIGCRTTLADINEKNRELANSVGADFFLISSPEEFINKLRNKDFILSAVSSANKKAPPILSHAHLSSISNNAIIIDTTPNNIEIKKDYIKTDTYIFHRNPYFERLAPITASKLWANNMLNLINLICLPHKQLNLSLKEIEPMLYSKHHPKEQK